MRKLPAVLLFILVMALSTGAAYINLVSRADDNALYLGEFAGRSLVVGPLALEGSIALDCLDDLYLLSRPDGAEPAVPYPAELLGRLPGGGVIVRLRPSQAVVFAGDPGLHYRALTPILRAAEPPAPLPVGAGRFDDYVELVDVDSIDAFNYTLTEFRTRYAYSAPIKEARDYLAARLEDYGFEVRLQSWLGEAAVGLAVAGELVLVGSRMSYAFFSLDGGGSFETFLPPEGPLNHAVLGCAAFEPETFHYAAGSRYYRSLDGGGSWQGSDLFPETEFLRALSFADAEHGYAVSDRSTFMATQDGGGSWEEAEPLAGTVYGLHASTRQAGVIHAVGGQTRIWRSADYGQSWEPLHEDGPTLRAVSFNANGVGLAVGNGVALRSDDGHAWEPVEIPGTDASTFFTAVAPFGDDGFAVTGQLGTLWLSRDNGVGWERIVLDKAGVLNSAAHDGGRLWVAGQDGPFSSTDGRHFIDHSAGLDPDCEIVWHNVIGEKRGGEHPESIIYLTAHYDSIAVDVDPRVLAPGANDNASGVAALLETARILAGHQPRRTLRLVFFDAEELGLRGSAYHVNNLVRAGERADAVINADMVVWSDPPGEQQDLDIVTNEPSLWLAEYLAAACGAYGAGMPGTVIVDGDFARSDHAPFWFAGFPALLAIEDKTVPYPYYHTSEDDYPAISDHFGFTRQVTRALVGATLGLTGAPADWEAGLDFAYAYPNPFRARQHATVTFTGLVPNTEISVYDISGSLLYQTTSSGPLLDWSAVNSAGNELASGVYIYLLRAPDGQTVNGRLAVIR